MEAIAAAGALPGLASATIQLGTATFQFYQQLHGLYKAIKHGENDLNTAARRLDQHGDFINELRFNFERISEPGVSTSTRDLFERYIADSEVEVEEFKTLLNRVGKQHFKRKSLQAIETGSRLRFHEHSIQKYCDLLDKQMQRFLFLQSSVQSMRIESSLSEVMDTLVKQGAQAVAFYDEHSQSSASSNEIRLPLRGAGKRSHTAAPLQDVIPNNLFEVQFKTYSTLCGTVTVAKFSDRRTSNASDRQFAYKVQFKPYGWISRTLVEWRCLISSTHRAPTLMLSVTTGIICEDPDVIDALGLITCTSRWDHGVCHPKLPNSSKVRALLDTGRLLREHVVYGSDPWSRTDILTAYFACLAHCDYEWKIPEDVCCSWDSAELVRYYREFYDVTELLLSRGFEPTFSSWQSIYDEAVQCRWRITQCRPALISTMNQTFESICALILKTCGYSVPISVEATLKKQLLICSRRLYDAGVSPYIGHYVGNSRSFDSYCHLGHVIALQFPAEIIKKEIPDLDLLDLADEQNMLDRWLLGLFAPHRPEIALCLQQYLKSYKTTTAHKRFEVEYIREEIKRFSGELNGESNANLRGDLLKFICFHGNATILQQLDLTALTPWEIESMLQYASQSSARDIFDILTSHMQSAPRFLLLHTKMMSERLTADPVFLRNFVASLRTQSQPTMLSNFFKDSFSGALLFATDSYPLPAYMQNFIVGLVQVYETHPTPTGCMIHSLIYFAMAHHWTFSKSAERLLENLHLYYLLDLLARSSAFKPLLDASSSKNVNRMPFVPIEQEVYLHPSVNGYSPLMLALHCGMRPAVQILVDAGASILTPSNCGKSPLSVAYEHARARHPRQWAGKYDPASQISTLSFNGKERRFNGNIEDMWVSESTDKEMLEILLKALRDRGEEIEEDLDELPRHRKWETLREKTRYFCRWLFKPSYTFDPDAFRENSIYVILVTTLWFLSVLKVLKAELGDYPSHITSLLSRPVVVLTLVVLTVSILR